MIYLDNAATTRLSKEALEAMLPYFTENYGNPGGIYSLGASAKKAVTEARETLANCLGVTPGEIYFTSGGTESDNWAIKATIQISEEKGHIITTSIEHPAVLRTCRYLEQLGVAVTYVDVDAQGIVDVAQLKRAIRPNTVLISVMAANNEVGTIQPLKEIGQIAKEHNILFHTDAVQAFGQIPLDVEECHIDMLSASAHKVNGPKGIGLLYIRKGIKLPSLIHGGGQERFRRAGTENVPGAVGFAVAAKESFEHLAEKIENETRMREYLIHRLETEILGCKINGSRKNRLPNNVNVSFEGVSGEAMLILLDQKGICASGGSACTTGAVDPSHVLLAMGLPKEQAEGTLRLTLSEENTMEELDYTVECIHEIVQRLR